jgi:hypothetical protein
MVVMNSRTRIAAPDFAIRSIVLEELSTFENEGCEAAFAKSFIGCRCNNKRAVDASVRNSFTTIQ